MGEVYRARDRKLDRDVAVKILPQALATDPDRIARFEREAKTLAALNHPNIAQIYGVEESDGIRALVMELVEGPTLADRIAQGPIPIDEALPLAKQITEALEAAHEQGIIHRDLKPANIKVRGDGTVKLLDFGLAKAFAGDELRAASGTAALTNSPTLASPAMMTSVGLVLGTAAYMAPEQAKGRPVDRRADVWAFGCVLYEMLTGQRAFEGDDVSDIFAAILRAEPNWGALPPDAPPAIRRLLRRTLEKDVRSRLSDMAMVRVELRDATTDPRDGSGISSGVIPSGAFARRYVVALAVTVLAIALVTSLVIWRARRPLEAPRSLARFAIELPDQMQLPALARNVVAISPDGTHLAFAVNGRLYVRGLDQLAATPVSGTDAGGPGGSARSPFFSPDGQWVAYWQQGQMRRVAFSGGAPVPICDVPFPPVGASWEPDGDILLGAGPIGIAHVLATGGTPQPLIALKNGELAGLPQGLPGGKWILFLAAAQTASAEQSQAVVQSLSTGERRVLVDGVRFVRYVPSGHLLFGRGNRVFAETFDPDRLVVTGSPVPVLDGVATTADTAPGMHVAVSSFGTLIYLPGSVMGATSSSRLVLVARDGTPSALAEITGMTWFPRFSPDGSRIAYGVSPGTDLGTDADLWVLDVARAARTRVTFTGNNRFYPIWTRDGRRLTFADGVGPTNRLLWTLADGSGKPETLLDVGTRRYPTSWAPDGRTLAFYQGSAGGGTNNSRDLWMLHLDGDKPTTVPFVETPFEERGAIFSPDGRWVAYVSDKSGQNDVYARPYPGPSGEVTVSVGGGQEPVWAPSGRELFYRHDGKLLTVAIEERGTSLTVGSPSRVLDDSYRLDTGGAQGEVANYDISPNGQRFVMVEEPKLPRGVAPPATRLQVVLNWFEELKARVPTK
jgi:serine/threonine-protein kinase